MNEKLDTFVEGDCYSQLKDMSCIAMKKGYPDFFVSTTMPDGSTKIFFVEAKSKKSYLSKEQIFVAKHLIMVGFDYFLYKNDNFYRVSITSSGELHISETPSNIMIELLLKEDKTKPSPTDNIELTETEKEVIRIINEADNEEKKLYEMTRGTCDSIANMKKVVETIMSIKNGCSESYAKKKIYEWYDKDWIKLFRKPNSKYNEKLIAFIFECSINTNIDDNGMKNMSIRFSNEKLHDR